MTRLIGVEVNPVQQEKPQNSVESVEKQVVPLKRPSEISTEDIYFDFRCADVYLIFFKFNFHN